MLKKKLARISLLVVVVLGATALALALSTGISEAQGPGDGQGGAGRGGYGPGDGSQGIQPVPGVGLPSAGTDELSDAAVEALMAAIQDEYHAYAVYQVVIDQFGPVAPFTRIQAAEAQHIAALEVLLNRYDIPIPAPEPLEDLPQFSSIAGACALGAEAEIANFELYDSWMAQTRDYPDLVQVFASLRSASEFNHLPAFEQCAG
jgi:hypothetical protein